MFPVDPRDFVVQAFENNVQTCEANLAATDPPKAGGYQFQWSLGTPFLKRSAAWVVQSFLLSTECMTTVTVY